MPKLDMLNVRQQIRVHKLFLSLNSDIEAPLPYVDIKAIDYKDAPFSRVDTSHIDKRIAGDIKTPYK